MTMPATMPATTALLWPTTARMVTMIEAGLPRAFLRPLLLVALRSGSSHGYELAEQLRMFGLTTVDLAGIYRTLRVLEHDQFVESRWERSEQGPARRVYTLTQAGDLNAVEQIAWLRDARGFLDHALDAVANQ